MMLSPSASHASQSPQNLKTEFSGLVGSHSIHGEPLVIALYQPILGPREVENAQHNYSSEPCMHILMFAKAFQTIPTYSQSMWGTVWELISQLSLNPFWEPQLRLDQSPLSLNPCWEPQRRLQRSCALSLNPCWEVESAASLPQSMLGTSTQVATVMCSLPQSMLGGGVSCLSPSIHVGNLNAGCNGHVLSPSIHVGRWSQLPLSLNPCWEPQLRLQLPLSFNPCWEPQLKLESPIHVGNLNWDWVSCLFPSCWEPQLRS